MGRWAESHDQRKGQWLFNKIREKYPIKNYDPKKGALQQNNLVANILWNISNEEFDEMLGDYFN